MRKLTISALIAVGFFASDVAANPVDRVGALYRQAPQGDFCNNFHKHVCKGGDADIPPPGKPDLCNDQVCQDFLSANPDFLGCIDACKPGDRQCFEACFPPPPARRRVVRRQPPPHGPQGGPPKPAGPNNHGPANGNQQHGPQNGPGDFCASLEQLCQAGPIERFRRRQDNNGNANGNGNGNGHGGNNEQGPNLCDRETCDAFVHECPSFPPCVHNCKEGDHDCVEKCFECNGEGHQEAPARRRQPPPHPQGGNGAPHPAGGNGNHPGPKGPPPALPPAEGDFCLSLNELCNAEGPAPAEARIHRRRQENNQGAKPEHAEGNGAEGEFPLCDLETCDAFLEEKPCFPKCVANCAEADEKCVEQCFDCKPERLRRRRAIRKSHN